MLVSMLKITTSTEATIAFHSTKENSTFTCQIDSEFWGGCESPKTYAGLSVGVRQFKVQAIDAQNHEEPSPSIFDWQIVTPGVDGGTPGVDATIEISTSTESIATSTTP